jgi:hypothetical protein
LLPPGLCELCVFARDCIGLSSLGGDKIPL